MHVMRSAEKGLCFDQGVQQSHLMVFVASVVSRNTRTTVRKS